MGQLNEAHAFMEKRLCLLYEIGNDNCLVIGTSGACIFNRPELAEDG